MSLMNDFAFQILNDQRERELAEMAANDRRVLLARAGHVSWWQRVLSHREPRRIAVATPEHRVAH
jgi:hypothetical protein